MNRNVYCLIFCLLFVSGLYAQVKIGNNPTEVSPSAVLEIETPNKGLILPRVANVALIQTPVNGMMVYDVSLRCVRSFNGEVWSPCHAGGLSEQKLYLDGEASGFVGNFSVGLPTSLVTHYYKVKLINNSFSTPYTFLLSPSDLVLSGTTGLSVGDVALTPNGFSVGSVTIPTAESRELYYRITGTPSIPGVLLGVWSKDTFSDTDAETIEACPTASSSTATNNLSEGSSRVLTALPLGGSWSVVSGVGSISNGIYYAPFVTQDSQVVLQYQFPGNSVCPTQVVPVTFTVQDCPALVLSTSSQNLKEGTTRPLVASLPNGVWSIISGGGFIGNGVYSAPDVDQDTTVTLRYTVAENGACTEKMSEVTFTVVDCKVAQNLTSTADLAEGASKQMIGTPAGGYWTLAEGLGTIDEENGFYTAPQVSQDMPVKLRYTLPSTNSVCSTTTSDAIFTVKNCPENPVISFNTGLIVENTSRSISFSPAGGSWTLNGSPIQISGNTFTAPEVNTTGTFTLQYTVGPSVCPKSTSVSFAVFDCASVTSSTNLSAISDSEFSGFKNLSFSPSGGVFEILQGGGSISNAVYYPADVSSTTVVKIRYKIDPSCSSFVDIEFKVLNGIPDRYYDVEVNTQKNHNFVYRTVNIGGATWLNNNLGAEYADENASAFNPAQQATGANDYLAFGSLFQGGRAADGHELYNFDSTHYAFPLNHVSNTAAAYPPDEHFILKEHWQGSFSGGTWAGVNAPNNPCPVGFRIPTIIELQTMVSQLGINSSSAAASSAMRIPATGHRGYGLGEHVNSGITYLWSSSNASNGATLQIMKIDSTQAVAVPNVTGEGLPVRCIKN